MEDIELTVGDDRENSRPNSPLEGYDGVCTLDDEDPVPGNVHQKCSYENKRRNITTEIDHTNEEAKPTTKEKKKSLAGFFIIFRVADCLDRLLMLVGVLAAILNGAALPISWSAFSEAIDLFVADAIARSQLEFSRNASIATTAPHTEDITTMIRPLCVRLTYWAVIIIAAGSVHVFCWKLTSERQVSRLRSQLFSAILYKDCAWFDSHDTGSLVVSITNDIVNIESGMSDKVSLCIQHLSVFVVAIIMALATSWRLSLAVLAVTPLTVLSVVSIVIVTQGASARQAKAYAQAGSVATEVLSAIRTVAAFGGELKDAVRYQESIFSARKVGIIKGLFLGCATGIMTLGNYSMFGIANWYGTSLIGSGVSGSSVVFVLIVLVIGSKSLGQSLPNLDGVATAGGSAVTIFQVIDTEPQIRSRSEDGLKPECLHGNIEFEKVDFVYETRPEIKVLDGVPVRIEAGQTVALVGPSGSGKSTLCYLLLRLYDCTAGRLQVTVDGHDIKNINVKWLRQHIGVVSQEPVLFDGSISDNIRLGLQTATQADIEDAAKMANAHDFILEFPDTYDTLVGERGTQLSGGQKQRIAIARALISNPKILLLDEATSALDSESEALVQHALDKARQGRTTVVVAHRLSTIRNADVIHCLSGGRVVESGSHDNLMNMEGLYHDLVVSQQTNMKSNEDPGDVITKRLSTHDVKDETVELQKKKLDEANENKHSDDITKEDTELEERQKSVFVRLMMLNATDWLYFVVGCIAAFLVGGASPMIAVIYSIMMKNFAVTDRDEQMSEARTFSIVVFGVAILVGVVHCVHQLMFEIVGENLTMRLRRLIFTCMLRQEIGWFDQPKNKIGILTSRLAVDATIVRGVSGTQLGNVFLAASSLLVSFLVAFVSSWKLSLVVLLFIPFLVAAGIARGKDVRGSAQRSMRAAEQGGKIASDAISNIRTVAALTIESKFKQTFDEFFDDVKRKQRAEAVKAGLFHGFTQSVIQFCYAAAFLYGSHLVAQGEIEFHQIFRVVFALIVASLMIGTSTSLAPDAQKARVAAKNIFDLLDRKSDSCAGDGKCPTGCRGEVTLDDIEFAYPSRPDAAVLRSLSVTVKPGQRVALVGHSGCGKSTCVSLMERFYDASSGCVRVDGVDVRSLNVQWLRAQLALVSQEPVLFNTTVYDNIAYGDNTRTPTMDEVIDAAKEANIHSFIASLPLGYDTNVGECGSQLSGGQKQRIAIARALLRNPRILLLDEATSALDWESEQLVQEALERAQEGRTCIVIAHRLSTIRSADKIVVVHDGRVVEEGTHDELMAQESFYHRLVQKQVMV